MLRIIFLSDVIKIIETCLVNSRMLFFSYSSFFFFHFIIDTLNTFAVARKFSRRHLIFFPLRQTRGRRKIKLFSQREDTRILQTRFRLMLSRVYLLITFFFRSVEGVTEESKQTLISSLVSTVDCFL